MIINGITASTLLWIGNQPSENNYGFQVYLTDVTFPKGDVTAFPPPFENKLLATYQYAEVILAKADIAKMTAQYAEVIAQPLTPALVTQAYAEIVSKRKTTARITQNYSEVVAKRAVNARITQTYVEVIRRP